MSVIVQVHLQKQKNKNYEISTQNTHFSLIGFSFYIM